MTLHTRLSYIKSYVRILGYAWLMIAGAAKNNTGKYLILAGAILLVAELIGIAEEAWPGAYKGTETDDTNPSS